MIRRAAVLCVSVLAFLMPQQGTTPIVVNMPGGAPAGVAPTIRITSGSVVGAYCDNADSALSCTTTAVSVIAGDQLYAVCSTPATSTVAVSDTVTGGPDTFVVANPAHNYTGTGSFKSWYVQSAIGGSTTFTCTGSIALPNIQATVVEFQGATSPALDQVGELDTSAVSSGTLNLASTSGATTQTNELAFAFLGAQTPNFTHLTPSSGCTVPVFISSQNYPEYLEYCTLSSAAVFSPTVAVGGTTSAAVSYVATFK